MTAIYLVFRDMIIGLLSLQLIHLQIILGFFGAHIAHHHHLIDWIIDQLIDVALRLRYYRKSRASSANHQCILSVGSIITLPLVLNKMVF
jgi:hypothetical protein